MSRLDPVARQIPTPTAMASVPRPGAHGVHDDVIDPRDTRPRLIDGLRMLRTKRDTNPKKKHGNIPL